MRRNLYGALLLATAAVVLAIAGCSNNGTSSGRELCREEANPDKRDYPGDGRCVNPNDQGPDVDGDGIKNGIAKDSDGDGTPDAEDETPGQVYPLAKCCTIDLLYGKWHGGAFLPPLCKSADVPDRLRPSY